MVDEVHDRPDYSDRIMHPFAFFAFFSALSRLSLTEPSLDRSGDSVSLVRLLALCLRTQKRLCVSLMGPDVSDAVSSNAMCGTGQTSD